MKVVFDRLLFEKLVAERKGTDLYFSKSEHVENMGITIGASYFVQSIAAQKDDYDVQVFDDSAYPRWFPMEIFEVVDKTMPADWGVNFFHANSLLVCGPHFMTDSLESFSDMYELYPAQYELLEKRRKEQGQIDGREAMLAKDQPPAIMVEDGWVLCPTPGCNEAWEVNLSAELVKCPCCETIWQNPYYVR